MLTRILHNSSILRRFIDDLNLVLTVPQHQHLLNMADALLVCENSKTIAALWRQFVKAPDPSNMADFLRISTWPLFPQRHALRVYQVKRLLDQGYKMVEPPTIYINLDDSIGQKGKKTRHIEVVDWHYDHSESTKGQPRYKNGFCYLVCTMQIGQEIATVDLRLYLREKTVRRHNRHRPRHQRLKYRSKYRLAQSILAELSPLLPQGWKVVVQFDSWYASAKLIKFCRRHGWHITCGLKYNRLLNGQPVARHAQQLKHKRYERITLTSADRSETTYLVRSTAGRLENISDEVRVFITKRHQRAKALSYFMSTDLACTTRQVLHGYSRRWSCEVDSFYLKTQVGLADFRVRSYEAVDRYIYVVHLAWAYVEQRFSRERSRPIQTYGDVIRQHRDEHAVDWLTGALKMHRETDDLEAVLEQFLR